MATSPCLSLRSRLMASQCTSIFTLHKQNSDDYLPGNKCRCPLCHTLWTDSSTGRCVRPPVYTVATAGNAHERVVSVYHNCSMPLLWVPVTQSPCYVMYSCVYYYAQKGVA